MEFQCYDVLEIEGRKYGIAEKISYREKDGDERWQEYGLKPEQSGAKWYLTISDDGARCVLSQITYQKTPPQGFRLCGKGVQKVIRVNGTSDAARGDLADYEEYESADGKFLFFIERWREDSMTSESNQAGKVFCASGRRIREIRLCSDADARILSARLHADRRRDVWRIAKIYWAFFFVSIGFIAWSEGTTWHDVRNVLGFPYTMEERMSDSPYFIEDKEAAQDQMHQFTTWRDPASVAIDFIESAGGDVRYAVQDTGASDARIAICMQKGETCLIYEEGGQTRVRVGKSGELIGEAERVQSAPARSYVLDRYAQMIRQGERNGREYVLPNDAQGKDRAHLKL